MQISKCPCCGLNKDTFSVFSISFAKEVGNILSEFPEEEQDKIRDHYRFFM